MEWNLILQLFDNEADLYSVGLPQVKCAYYWYIIDYNSAMARWVKGTSFK